MGQEPTLRRLLALGLGVALALAPITGASAKPVRAAGPTDLTFALNGLGDNGHHTVDPIDQLTWCGDCVGIDYTTGEPWVVNPHDNWPYGLPTNGAQQTGCAWDSDDRWSYVSTGNVIAAGATATVTECRYSTEGGYSKLLMDVGITSPSSALLVSIRWQWDTGFVVHPVLPTFDSGDHKWHYFECVDSAPPLGGTEVTIPNSHGGVSIPSLITVTVTNPTSQKIGKTGGFIEGGQLNGLSRGCASPWNPA